MRAPACEGLTRRGVDGFVCCPWHGEHERLMVARGTEPRLFDYGGRCAIGGPLPERQEPTGNP